MLKNSKDIKRFIKYCTGCGLCSSVNGVKFKKDENGYEWPILREDDLAFCHAICPSGGAALALSEDSIWGCTKEVFLGWSTDANIRMEASSGGVLTSLCIYLLENHIVDGIIQIQRGADTVYSSQVVISRTCADVLKCSGSRYSISMPLQYIKQIVQKDETYAFVGKPCDVSALRLYLKQDLSLENQIKYLLSFFCAGEPSETANLKLLETLDCKPEECIHLQYRGNGWPGYVTAIRSDGTSRNMSYNDSWGKILGRDVRLSCRFCMDGIGEMADIACGDGWYLTKDKQPNFKETKGRNIIFARTEKGINLLHKVSYDKKIHFNNFKKFKEDLIYIQKYQYERKASMFAMIIALKFFRRTIPNYNTRKLIIYAKQLPIKTSIRRFMGTCKRILHGGI